MKNNIVIRPELPEDVPAIYNVNKQAFGQENEPKFVDNLRNHGVLTISLVAVQNKEIVGHIAFSPVKIEPGYPDAKAITLAPLAVLPPYQNKGIGTKLTQAGIEECRRLGYDIVIVVGHANYYPRFGFVKANSKGLKCEFNAVPDEAWMVLEISKGALTGKPGTVFFGPEVKEAM